MSVTWPLPAVAARLLGAAGTLVAVLRVTESSLTLASLGRVMLLTVLVASRLKE